MKYLKLLIISVKIKYNQRLLNQVAKLKAEVQHTLATIERYEEEIRIGGK